VYHRADLDGVEKIKFLTYRDSNSDPSIFQPTGNRCADYTTPAYWKNENNIKMDV
jgi:hypothetical protein